MEIVDQIRQTANIIDIASQYTTLRKRGKKFVGLCPFHSEKDPSFTVDEDKQLFHCFGCGIGGDVFTLVMEKENLSFPEALKYLAEKYHIPLPQKRKLSPQLIKLEEKLFKINQETLAFFKKNLYNTQEGKKALTYLKKRGISEEIIQELKIGYALNSWDSLLTFFQSKNTPPDLLEKAGLILARQQKEGYYDRFRGRIIFPIFSLSGKVVAFGGRTIFEAEPKYLNSPDTPVYSKGKLLYGLNFCKEAIRNQGEVILVEGYTDFISLYKAGIHNVAASLGTSLTPQQVSLVARFAPRIIVSYDADEAGRKAALRAVSLGFEQGVQIKVINLPTGADPDSFISQNGPQSFKNLVKRSTPGLKFMIDSLLRREKEKTPEEKAKTVRQVVEEIEKIPDLVVRSEYIKLASQYLGLEEELLRGIARQKSSEEPALSSQGFLFPAEKRLIQILIGDKLIAPYIYAEMEEEDYQGLKSEPIFTALSDCFKNGKEMNFYEVKDKIAPPLRSSLSQMLLEKGSQATLGEALDCLYSLRQISLEKKSKKLKAEIEKIERKGEKEKLRALLSQRVEITKQLLALRQRNIKKMSLNKRENININRS
ncbi:MAG: DNA primase [Candidatus Aminicenantales bacterium]